MRVHIIFARLFGQAFAQESFPVDHPGRWARYVHARHICMNTIDNWIHTYIHACMHVHIHLPFTFTYTYTYIYIPIHTYTHIYIYTCLYIYMFVYMQSIVRAKTWEDRVSLQVVCSQTISLLMLGVTHFLSPKDSSALFRYGGWNSSWSVVYPIIWRLSTMLLVRISSTPGCPVKSLHQCIWDGRHQALVGCGMLMTLKSLFPITFLLSVPLPTGAVKHKADQQCSARFWDGWLNHCMTCMHLDTLRYLDFSCFELLFCTVVKHGKPW